MPKPPRRIRRFRAARALVLATPLAATLAVATPAAQALEVAQVTRYGYIVVDERDAPIEYEGAVPIDNNGELFGFISDETAAIDRVPGAPRPDYVATMQTERSASNGALAFYLPIRNDVRGLGMRSPTSSGEIYNINDILGTYFPLYGYVWLNMLGLILSDLIPVIIRKDLKDRHFCCSTDIYDAQSITFQSVS